jgi:hypothetical protein
MPIDSRAGECRRQRPDRRRRYPPLIDRHHFGIGGRRQAVRRRDETAHAYRDHYLWRDLLVSGAIIILSSMDAWLTLRLLDRGAVELNLLMLSLIEQNVYVFVQLKVALTSLCTLLLVIHWDFRVFRAYRVGGLLVAVLALYTVLVLYELTLLH